MLNASYKRLLAGLVVAAGLLVASAPAGAPNVHDGRDTDQRLFAGTFVGNPD